MWPAPTAEDWKKPCLLTWQRTWDDAVAVSKETGKPILVCINMDGEIASEHYAGVRYRQPEIAALYEPYVTVIASVYRHTPRDHDDEGKRISCPRFGGVTCGEHIAIEPVIYEKFCDGQRIAPRHIMVELDGRETYDVFYRNDTASVFEDIRLGIARRAAPAPTVVRSDRPILDRVGSREVTDRVAVEAAYEKADAATRKALLEAAARHADASPLDLLRLAVFGLDPEASRLAREALAKVEDPAATGLVADALRVPMDTAERDALIATLERLGGSSALARWLAVVHKGLAKRSSAVDPTAWTGPAGGSTYQPPALEGGTLSRDVESRADASKRTPTDPAARAALAEGLLALALEAPRKHAGEQHLGRLFSRHLLADARRTAEAAEKLGATGWRVNAVVALSAYYAGDVETGYARAAEAVKDLPKGDGSWTSMAVLTVFAEGRWKAIKKAVKEKLDFPPEWLSDVNAAYAVLLRHPLGTDDQVAWHYDLLDWLGAYDQAIRVLREGLARFRDSGSLHVLLRKRLLERRGPAGLEAAYEAMLAKEDASPRLPWFAAYASIAAAEQLRRNRDAEAALAAYGRALAHYERAMAAEPQNREAGAGPVALALAGRARVHYEAKDDARALEDVLASLATSPDTAGTRDGMGISPGETAQTLLARLRATPGDERAAKLEAALATVPPDLLRPDGE
jgi:tetratricopeptide (TPR) repeat protein